MTASRARRYGGNAMRGSTTGRRLSQFELDVMLAVGVFAAEVTGAAIAANQDPGGPPFRWWGAGLMAIAATALVFRRRRPFLVSLIVGLATGTYGVAKLPDPPLELALLVALYTIALLSDRRVVALVAVLAGVGALVGTMATGDSGLDDYYRNFLPGIVALVLGDRARTRAAYLRAVEQRAEDLERDRDVAAERAAAVERAHIARELHDVVAHHVSMMVVQAEAGAARLSTTDRPSTTAEGDGPPGASAAFDAISATGRSAMAELRRLLGVLRDRPESTAATAPQPGVDRLDRLVKEVRDTGLPLAFAVEGRSRPLADGIDVSAYRIVQEGLTNVLRHAGAVPTRVEVRYGTDAIELLVINECPPAGSPIHPPGDGRGLIGIRERVHLLGGELGAGPTADGGFELRVRLPTTSLPAGRS